MDDKEAQQDVREKLVDVHSKLMGLIQRAPYIRCEDAHRQYAVNWLMNNGVTVQEWISVKDRLPDKDGCYIVTACDEGCSCGDGIWYDTVVTEAEYYKGEWSWNENGTENDITDLVTHWQPMPQPPKGEKR